MTSKICLTRSEAIRFVELAPTTPDAVARLVQNIVLTPDLLHQIEKSSRCPGEVKFDYRVPARVEGILAQVPGATVSGLVRALLPVQISKPVPPERPVSFCRKVVLFGSFATLGLAVALCGWALVERSRATELAAALAATEAENVAVKAELARDQVLYDQAKIIFDWANLDPVRKREMEAALRGLGK